MRTLTLLFTAVLLAGCLPPEYPEITDTWEQLPDTLITNDMSNLKIELDTNDVGSKLYSLTYQHPDTFIAEPCPMTKASLATLIDDYKALLAAATNFRKAEIDFNNSDFDCNDEEYETFRAASNELDQLLNKLIS